MFSNEIKALADKIGEYYLQKNRNDVDAANEEIQRLAITDLSLDGGVVTIKTRRPGMLIGVRGDNIKKLEEALGLKIKIIEQASVEDLMLRIDEGDYWEDYDFVNDASDWENVYGPPDCICGHEHNIHEILVPGDVGPRKCAVRGCNCNDYVAQTDEPLPDLEDDQDLVDPFKLMNLGGDS